MKPQLLFILMLACIVACSQKIETIKTYPRQVGDSFFNSELDDSSFQPCNDDKVLQYYNFGKGVQFDGEKRAIEQYFFKEFSPTKNTSTSGYLTIRFIVNCKGNTGRFRSEAIDFDYKEIVMDSTLTFRLLELTKKLKGWKIGEMNGVTYDYYQYLTFKIEHGNLTEILP